ncbi:MAG: protein kinase [Chloroflexi bacterium]|nr:protein kinase [Chloroflexota bacterium]
MPRMSEGQSVDRWTLVELLGKGGNAEVWRARCDGEEVALKVLNQRRPESEAYRRFRNEIEALNRVGPRDHVLPLLDSHLPESPSRTNLAWLAMPIAGPLSEGLEQADLREVVTAVAEIARTLAQLEEEFQLHHRDIKPSNLYLIDGRAAISDFGLVDLPHASELTGSGRPLGPQHFLAYEMLSDPGNADPGPAHVYSLAKTLWVLATDQRWPPQGEQHASNDAYSIRSYQLHPHASQLDRLIERCTRHSPVARPSMQELSQELEAWLALDSATPQEAFDTSVLWEELRMAAQARLNQKRFEDEQEQCFRAVVRRMQQMLEAVNTEVAENFSAAEFNRRAELLNGFLYDQTDQETVREDLRATIVPGGDMWSTQLVIGTVIRVKRGGDVEYGAMYYLGRVSGVGGHLEHWKSPLQRSPCGSVVLEAGMSELATQIRERFPEWLGKLASALQSSRR